MSDQLQNNLEEKEPEKSDSAKEQTADIAEEKKSNSSKLIALLMVGAILVAAVIVISMKGKQGEPIGNPFAKDAPEGSTEKKLADQSKIKKFENYAELKEFLESNATDVYGVGGTMEKFSTMNNEMQAPSGMGAADSGFSPMRGSAQPSAPEGSDDYSATNVQVEGVDEADIIKSDGKYVYAVSNNNLFIVDAYPADKSEVLAKIEFKSHPQDIYVSGDRLVIFGNDYNFTNSDTYKRFIRKSNYTYFKVFDIADRKNPKEIKDLDIEGNYFESRMIGDYVYFITNTYSTYYDNELPVPRILDGGKEIYSTADGVKCNKCPDVYYFDMPYESYNFTNITAVNIKDVGKEIKNQVYLLSQNQNMYVSADNIYITYTKHVSEEELSVEVRKEILMPRLSDKEKERVSKIQEADSVVLSKAEKTRKVLSILQRYEQTLSADEQEKLDKEISAKLKEKYQDISKELEKTVIHKVAINKDEIEYKATGEVTGYVLNQFSMDENDGYLRIATTKNREWMPEFFDDKSDQSEPDNSYSNVYVLDADLKKVGAIENLAKGEQIYSVRFMQGRAYMVTFKQTDPLFVLDLKDPKNPKVLGQLKIPGFSNYLHPYDENTLIGIGKDTKENDFGGVTVNGVKVSMFDVSDVSNPKEINNYKFESGSDSIALSDHKAFLFSKEKNLMVIPVTRQPEFEPLRDRPEFSGDITAPMPSRQMRITNGAAVFKVDKSGVSYRGLIDHSNDSYASVRDSYCGYYNCYDNTVRRSLYISDILFTFSNRYLQMNKLDDLSEVKRLELKKGQSDDYKVVN